MTEQVDAYFNPEPGFVEGKSYLTPDGYGLRLVLGKAKNRHTIHTYVYGMQWNWQTTGWGNSGSHWSQIAYVFERQNPHPLTREEYELHVAKLTDETGMPGEGDFDYAEPLPPVADFVGQFAGYGSADLEWMDVR